MPTVLITRPKALSETLAATLRSLGYETVIEPLLSIMPLDTPQPQTGTVDAVMITSGNALSALKERQDGIAGLFDIPCFCVGPTTAEKASAFGFHRVQYAEGDGVELAKLINFSFEGKNASILHIAGRDVNGAARQELSARGHRVLDWPVYEAIPVAALTPGTRDLFIKQKLDAVMVFSPRTARILNGFLAEPALEACCTRLIAICLSEAVADNLRSLAWRHLISPPRPTEDAVIACLQEICPVKS